MILKVFLFLIIIVLAIYIFLYTDIQLNDTIYFSKNNEQFIVINKNLFTVTLSRIAQEPITVSTLDFILNYSKF